MHNIVTRCLKGLAVIVVLFIGMQSAGVAQTSPCPDCPASAWTCIQMPSAQMPGITSIVLPCGAVVVQITWCYRTANCSNPPMFDMYLQSFQVMNGTGGGCTNQQIVDQLRDWLLTYALNNPGLTGFWTPPNGFCWTYYRSYTSACWFVNAQIGENGDNVQVYGPCQGNVCCVSQYTVCNQNGSLNIVGQGAWSSQPNCNNLVPPGGGTGCWFVCDDN